MIITLIQQLITFLLMPADKSDLYLLPIEERIQIVRDNVHMQNAFEYSILILVGFTIVWIGTRILRNIVETWKTFAEGKKEFSRLKKEQQKTLPAYLEEPDKHRIAKIIRWQSPPSTNQDNEPPKT